MENNIITDEDLNKTISERSEYFNTKSIYFSELEMNTEYDESISFNHFFSIYQEFESDEDPLSKSYKKTIFPFLTNIDFVYAFDSPAETKETALSIKAKIKQFSTSHDENAKTDFLNKIKTYVDIIGMETTSFLLIPVLAKIVDEELPIKKTFLNVLPDFISLLKDKGDVGYNIIKNNILSIIDEMYHSEKMQNEYAEMAPLLEKNIVAISKALTQKDKEEGVLSILLSFANNDVYDPESSQKKLICIQLISSLSEDLGLKITTSVLLPQVCSFSDDEDVEIRLKVIDIISKVAMSIGPEIIQSKLYDMIKRLSNDKNFNVRKKIVKCIPEVLKINKEKCIFSHIASKNAMFVEIIEKLIIDNEINVRLAVIELIGNIIAQLDKEELSMKIFNFYKNTLEEFYFNLRDQVSSFSSVNYGMMIYNAAYNFPAVLYCYGKDTWEQLRKTYVNLCSEKSLQIRRSIIDSFHEVCAILGSEVTERELLPIYDGFLESTVKEEKQYALRNLPKIIKNVDKSIKEKYFKYIDPVVLFQSKEDNKVRNFKFTNWRNKLDVVESVLCYFNLYDNDIIYSSILPQCIIFTLDNFYKVRSVSAKVLANLISYLYNTNYNKEKLVTLLKTFAFSKKFHNRISFIKMCKVLLMNYALYKEIVFDILNEVSNDKNVSVRISCAKMLSKIIKNDKCPCYNDKGILNMCHRLKKSNIKSINDILNDIILVIDNDESIDTGNELKVFKGEMTYITEEFKIDIDSITS